MSGWYLGELLNHPRRAKAKLPQDAHHVEKWRQALVMIDELIGWGMEPPAILADGAYGDNTRFRMGIEELAAVGGVWPGLPASQRAFPSIHRSTAMTSRCSHPRRSRAAPAPTARQTAPRAATAQSADARSHRCRSQCHPAPATDSPCAAQRRSRPITWRSGTRGRPPPKPPY